MNNQKWERKYPPVSQLDICLIDVHPYLRKRLKIWIDKMEAPTYTEAIDFLLDFYEEAQNERRKEKEDT